MKTRSKRQTKNVSTQGDKMPKDIGNFGAYMFVVPRAKGPRVMVFYYIKMFGSEMYKYAVLDNFVDGPGDADKTTLKGILSKLFHNFEMYNGLVHTPSQMHELIKHKVSKFYSLKWVEKNYNIVGNDFRSSGFM